MNSLLWAIIVWLVYSRESESQPDYRPIWKLKVDDQSGHEVFTNRKFVFPKSWHDKLFFHPGVSMSVTLTSNQKVTASVEFKDRKGNAAVVESAEWLTDNSDLLELVPSADGKSCDIVAKGMVGSAKVTMVADAEIGDGTTELRATGEVFVQAGQATVVDMTFNTPSEQEETNPTPPTPTPDEPAPTPPPSV